MIMKIKGIALFGVAAVLFGIAMVYSPIVYACTEQAGQSQKCCPIMGYEVDRAVYLDHEDERVYFCCVGCKSEFLNNPDKVITEMTSKGIVLEKTAVK